jgi:hypothetical protein
MDQTTDDTAPSGFPDGFYAGLDSTAIQSGVVNVILTFMNETDSDVTVEWNDSRLYLVTVSDITGTSVDVTALLGPYKPDQPPTTLPKRTRHSIVFPVDTSKAPYAGNLTFDPAKGPYTAVFKLNSSTHPFTLTAAIPVLAPLPPLPPK